jgi:hypothetical protein
MQEAPDAVNGATLSRLAYGCLTHVALATDFPAFVEPILLGDAQKEGGLNLRDLAPEWEPYHPILGGLAGTFAMKNHVLSHHPGAKQVGLCQYRKFVSNRRLSRAIAPSYKAMDLVSRRQVSASLLGEVMLPRSEWLLARPFMLSNWRKHSDCLEQYGRVHHPQDLLRFTAEAVEQRLLDKTEAVGFLAEELMLPGGIELGVFPADFWVRTVTAIESVVRACVKRWNVAREGYDARAWAFCVERLGSYLVLRELRTLPGFELRLFDLRWASPNHWSRRFGGRLNLLTDDADDYVIGA